MMNQQTNIPSFSFADQNLMQQCWEEWKKATKESVGEYERVQLLNQIMASSQERIKLRMKYEAWLARHQADLQRIFDEEYFKRHEKERPVPPTAVDQYRQSRFKQVADHSLYTMEAYSWGLIGVFLGAIVVFQGNMMGKMLRLLLEIQYYQNMQHITLDELDEMLAYLKGFATGNNSLDFMSNMQLESWIANPKINPMSLEEMKKYEQTHSWTESVRKAFTEGLLVSSEDLKQVLIPHLLALMFMASVPSTAVIEKEWASLTDDEVLLRTQWMLRCLKDDNPTVFQHVINSSQAQALAVSTDSAFTDASLEGLGPELQEEWLTEWKEDLIANSSNVSWMTSRLMPYLQAYSFRQISTQTHARNLFEYEMIQHIASLPNDQRAPLVQSLGWTGNAEIEQEIAEVAKNLNNSSPYSKTKSLYAGYFQNAKRPVFELTSVLEDKQAEEREIKKYRDYSAVEAGMDLFEISKDSLILSAQLPYDYIMKNPNAQSEESKDIRAQQILRDRQRMKAR